MLWLTDAKFRCNKLCTVFPGPPCRNWLGLTFWKQWHLWLLQANEAMQRVLETSGTLSGSSTGKQSTVGTWNLRNYIIYNNHYSQVRQNLNKFVWTLVRLEMCTAPIHIWLQCWVGECFFWYRLTWVVPDKFHRAVKRLCVCVCACVYAGQLKSCPSQK